MATSTDHPAPEDRTTKRQKGEDNGSSSQQGESHYSPRPPQQHPNPMYPGYNMGMGGPGGSGPYAMGGGPGMPPGPPYGQYGNPHGPPHPHPGSMYGAPGGYGGPHGRGHSSPERSGRSASASHWTGYSRGPPPSNTGGSSGPQGKNEELEARNAPPGGPHPYGGGWGHGHPQQWQSGPYGPHHSGYGGHHNVPPQGPMYSHSSGGQGGWSANREAPPHGGAPPPSNNDGNTTPTPSSSQGPSNNDHKSPSQNRARPDSATPSTYGRQPQKSAEMPSGSGNSVFCMEVGSAYDGRASVTHDGENSSVSGSTRDKGRGSYKCGRCGVPKKGHICPYQPKVKRRPDEPPPETRNAAVQVEMDEFMTLRRLNIRIQGFPESYATEPFMGACMVGAETHASGGEPLLLDPSTALPPEGMMPMDDLAEGVTGPDQPSHPNETSSTGTPPPEIMGEPPASPLPQELPVETAAAALKDSTIEQNGPIAEITDLSGGKEEKKEA